MKAHINGITVEGTPQEIMEYQRLQAEQAQMKQQKVEFPDYQPWFGIFPPHQHGTGTAKPTFPPDTMIICMNMTDDE